MQSVDQLLKVRVGAVELKNKILQLNQELQATGGKMIEKVTVVRPVVMRTGHQ